MASKGHSAIPRIDGDINRRSFLKCMGTAIAPLAFPGLLSGSDTSVRIGIFGPSHCAVPFVYAHLSGYFKDADIPVDLINYPSMYAIARDLVNGQLDFGQLVVPLVFALHTGSGPFPFSVPMVVPQITGTDGAVMMLRTGSGIQAPQDFKGKTVTNHSRLAVHYLLNRMFLEKHGLDFESDIDFIITPLDKVALHIQAGRVDASIMPEPINALMEHKAIAKTYVLSRHLWSNHPCCCLTTRRRVQVEKPRQFEAVTHAMMRASQTVNNPDTRETTINLLQSTHHYQYENIPKAVLMRAFTPGRSDFHPFPYQSAAILIAEQMKKYKLLAPSADPRRLAREVFLSQHARQVMADFNISPPLDDFRVEKVLGFNHLFHRS